MEDALIFASRKKGMTFYQLSKKKKHP